MEKMYEGVCHCGLVKWTFSEPIESVTACNCTLCRKYGALWGYGFLNQQIKVSGATSVYQWANKVSGFNFCSHCGCVVYYLVNKTNADGRRKIAVNLRTITEPDKIADLPIDHFDGLHSFDDLPRDGKVVRDLWF